SGKTPAADGHGQKKPDDAGDEGRAEGEAQTAVGKLSQSEQRGEAADVWSVHDGKLQDEQRLTGGDEAGDEKRHAVKVRGLFDGKMQHLSGNAGKHEHSDHAENILEAEHERLAERQRLVNADVEDG